MGLGTSSSHAGDSSSEAAAAATDSRHHPSHESQAACHRGTVRAGQYSQGPAGPAQGPLASDAACGHTVRSQSHGPNVMIICWPGAVCQYSAAGFASLSESVVCHVRTSESLVGVTVLWNEAVWASSLSHAGGSSSEAAAAAAATDGHILSHKSGSSRFLQNAVRIV